MHRDQRANFSVIIGFPEAMLCSYLVSHVLVAHSEYIPHYVVPLGWSSHGGLEESDRFPFQCCAQRTSLDCESRSQNGTLLKAQRGFKLDTYRIANGIALKRCLYVLILTISDQ